MLDKLKFFQTETHSKCLVSKTAACCDEKKMSGLGNFKVLFIHQTFLKVNHFIIYGVLYVLVFPSHYYVSVDLRINL